VLNNYFYSYLLLLNSYLSIIGSNSYLFLYYLLLSYKNLLNNKIDLVYENTSTILADNLTKSTSYNKFQDYKYRISLISIKDLN
jgi:hypothetical protein